MRVLITGVNGFVGGHLASLCLTQGATVVGVARRPSVNAEDGALGDIRSADLTDGERTAEVVREARPDRVFHLAADASVGRSWTAPKETLDNNLASSLNLLEAVRTEAPAARILVACSGEEYGPVSLEQQPITEDQPLRPQNPYAVSKAAVDLLAGFYADAHGLSIIRARAFNHAGPGQEQPYVIASLARQVAAAELAGDARVDLKAGDLTVRRDFTDVRDVVRAYWLALDRCPQGAYNVCSGRSVVLTDLVEELRRCTSLEIAPVRDPGLMRRADVREVRGSNERLSRATGWRPEIGFATTVRDALQSWRDRLGRAAP